MMASISRIKVQWPVQSPTAPTAMAASSALLAKITTLRLGNRSATHPAGAANTRNGSVNTDRANPCIPLMPAATARIRIACL